MRPRLGLAAVVIALVGGCGGADEPAPPSDEEQVRALVTRWLEALDEKDGKTACSLATPETVQGMKERGQSCEQEAAARALSFPGTPEVSRVRVEGEEAVALVRYRLGETPIRAALLGDEWLLGDPPGASSIRLREVF